MKIVPITQAEIDKYGEEVKMVRLKKQEEWRNLYLDIENTVGALIGGRMARLEKYKFNIGNRCNVMLAQDVIMISYPHQASERYGEDDLEKLRAKLIEIIGEL